jgi:quinoprotein glucose dehydrogenase
MNRKLVILVTPGLVSGLLMIVGLFTTSMRARAQAGGEHKSIWSGLYTDEEATRGQEIFEQYCVSCHGAKLEGGAGMGGPQLAGDKFVENWREDTVEDLFVKIRTTMPRRGFQGSEKSLSDREALDLVAFIFKKNGFPTGSGLNASGINNVWIEQQSGPKPLPNNSQIQVVGCMDQEADNWVITKGAQPTRLRTSGEKVDPDVLKTAEARPLGSLKFRLTNMIMLGAFTPDEHKGHKMLAQGVLVRQSSGDRLSVTLLEMVSANCAE